MECTLAGKVALVSGGGRGIGQGIAVELARAGADVCVADLNPAAETVAAVQALGRRGLFAHCDVSDRAAVEAAVAACTQELGPVDILVTSAVVSKRDDILSTRFDDLRRAVEVGVYGAFHLMQVVGRQMVERRAKGSIIHVTSPHAYMPFRKAIDYNVAKAAAHQLAMSAANELMWYGIRVNLVEPGWTNTPGEHRWYTPEELEAQGRRMPLGRLSTPQDLGRAVVFLCSDAAEYIVGTHLKVDGGQLIQGPAWVTAPRHGEGN